MPIFQLTDEIVFPAVELSEPEGLLALGGDLSADRLLLAYRSGIFPWYSEDQPILWWSPDPRFVLFPDQLKISASMRRVLKSDRFRISFDKDFRSVISRCRITKRKEQDDTWITEEMLEAYCALHTAGYAHSVEVWDEDNLVGGLYGISLGKAFFGESMFAEISNASKAGFITLVQRLKLLDFDLIDCQVPTEHLRSLGAGEIQRDDFLNKLNTSMESRTTKGNWETLWPGP